MIKREVMMESENRTGAGSRDGGLGPALAVLIAAAAIGALLAAAPLGDLAVSLARDVGNNCSAACLFGAVGAALAAACVWDLLQPILEYEPVSHMPDGDGYGPHPGHDNNLHGFFYGEYAGTTAGNNVTWTY